MTLVQFIVNFPRLYVDLPEFTSCVMKALKELKHPVNTESMYVEESGSISQDVYDKILPESCKLAGKEAHTVIIDELCSE